jgi:hypothetical protein
MPPAESRVVVQRFKQAARRDGVGVVLLCTLQ